MIRRKLNKEVAMKIENDDLNFGLRLLYAVVSANLILEYLFEGSVSGLMSVKFVVVSILLSVTGVFIRRFFETRKGQLKD